MQTIRRLVNRRSNVRSKRILKQRLIRSRLMVHRGMSPKMFLLVGSSGVFTFNLARCYATKAVAEGEKKTQTIFDFNVVDIDGNKLSLDKYKGKVCLVVNIASKCGFTEVNYKELVELYEKYKGKGFEVLAFPCNQFGKQEPGESCDIKSFAQAKKATFPVFEKIEVNGKGTHPLYVYLKGSQSGMLGSDIKWNFTKFLCDKNGVPIRRYAPNTPPSAIESDIVNLLK